MIEELIAIANQPTISALTSIFASLAILSLIILFFLFLFFIAIYVYFALAWYMIAKKLKYKNAWLHGSFSAFLLPILAKRKWGWGSFVCACNQSNFCNYLVLKIYERRGYPGALSLFKAGYIIPPIFPLVFIIDIVITGIVAWEKKK